MKMLLDDAADLNVISAYEDGRVQIRGEVHETGLLILPRRITKNGVPRHLGQLDQTSFRDVLEDGTAILIIGTGERQVFPSPQVFAPLMAAGVGFEVMDNRAACRTFNILLGENRDAALLLLADDA